MLHSLEALAAVLWPWRRRMAVLALLGFAAMPAAWLLYALLRLPPGGFILLAGVLLPVSCFGGASACVATWYHPAHGHMRQRPGAGPVARIGLAVLRGCGAALLMGLCLASLVPLILGTLALLSHGV